MASLIDDSGTTRFEGTIDGALPAQWTVDPDTGSLEITLTGASGDHDFGHAFRIFNSDGSLLWSVDTSGDENGDVPDADAEPIYRNFGSIGGVNRVFRVTSKGNNCALIFNTPGEVPDNALSWGDCAFWIDSTPGAVVFHIKAKENATGVPPVYRTAAIPLT